MQGIPQIYRPQQFYLYQLDIEQLRFLVYWLDVGFDEAFRAASQLDLLTCITVGTGQPASSLLVSHLYESAKHGSFITATYSFQKLNWFNFPNIC